MKKRFKRLLAACLLVATGIAHAQPAVQQDNASVEGGNAIRVLLSPELETTLTAQMAGRISHLQAQLGARVEKGRTVVAFDCAEAAARLDMARAEHAAATETLGAKQRLRKLEAAGDVEVSLAVAEANKAKAAIALSRAQLA